MHATIWQVHATVLFEIEFLQMKKPEQTEPGTHLLPQAMSQITTKPVQKKEHLELKLMGLHMMLTGSIKLPLKKMWTGIQEPNPTPPSLPSGLSQTSPSIFPILLITPKIIPKLTPRLQMTLFKVKMMMKLLS